MQLISKYGLLGTIRMLCFVLRTKLFYSNSRLIRFPFEIRNKKYIDLGIGLTTGIGCRLEAYPLDESSNKCLTLGNNIEMNDYVHITAVKEVRIGNDVLLASKIYISDCAHGNYSGTDLDDSPLTPPNSRPLVAKPVIIEDNVWIGEFVSILPGVTIGKGSIIGTMSVVTKDIPAYCIAVGSPARVIKKYNFETKHWEKV